LKSTYFPERRINRWTLSFNIHVRNYIVHFMYMCERSAFQCNG
jgi:hypothetical protein